MSRTTRLIATAVVVAAVCAPAGQAMTRIITDNSPGQNGNGKPAPVYVHSLGLSQSVSAPFSTAVDAYKAEEHPVVSPAVSFTSENAPSQNRVSLLNAAETGTLVSSSNSFDWGDAGVGAGVLAGVLLLIGAATVAVRKAEGRRLAI